MGSLVRNNSICPEPEDQWGIEIVESEPRVLNKRVSGAYLTWEDVGVTVSSSSWSARGDTCKTLLNGVTGYAKPGEIVAIMGPSGCGKSTLLDCLAGRLPSNTRPTGRILVNGQKPRLTYRTLAYMSQEQVLTWTLTVKETAYYAAELQLPKTMPKSMKRERADKTIREMGLQDSMNTRIGGWGIKGLSGGQKRRLSICLELLTHPKLLLLDEPTSGLDSAASYHVMNKIAKLTRQYGMTVLTAIHQPSSQVFGLFNNLCLLSSGKTIYFGPAIAANQFFAENGFPCPDLQSPSDHFLLTINTDFNEDTVNGNTPAEKAIDVLSDSYSSSEIYMEIKSEIAAICVQEEGLTEKAGLSQHASSVTQCLVLTERSFKNMYRDIGYYWLRLGIYIVLGFAVGTIFFNLGSDFGSLHARISILMYVSSFLTILAIGGYPSFMEEMKVFQWERLNGHYGVGSFVISNMISSTPYLLIISLVPGAIAYFLAGLQRECGRFIYFALVLFASMLLVECLMMIVATVLPNLLMGIITGCGIQGLMILSAGFFRLPNDMPRVFWTYPMYYVAFHRYVVQGLYKNEFEGLKLPAYLGGPSIDGETILKDVLQVEMGYSKWIDLVILFGMVFVYRVILFCTIKTAKRVKPIIKAFLLSSTCVK